MYRGRYEDHYFYVLTWTYDLSDNTVEPDAALNTMNWFGIHYNSVMDIWHTLNICTGSNFFLACGIAGNGDIYITRTLEDKVLDVVQEYILPLDPIEDLKL